MSARAKGLGEEIRQLRQQAEQLSSPDTFVQSSKLKRAANAKEKELESVWQELQGNHKSKGARNIKVIYYITGFKNQQILPVWFRPPIAYVCMLVYKHAIGSLQ